MSMSLHNNSPLRLLAFVIFTGAAGLQITSDGKRKVGASSTAALLFSFQLASKVETKNLVH